MASEDRRPESDLRELGDALADEHRRLLRETRHRDATDACLPVYRLAGYADHLEDLEVSERSHLEACAHCQSVLQRTYAVRPPSLATIVHGTREGAPGGGALEGFLTSKAYLRALRRVLNLPDMIKAGGQSLTDAAAMRFVLPTAAFAASEGYPIFSGEENGFAVEIVEESGKVFVRLKTRRPVGAAHVIVGAETGDILHARVALTPVGDEVAGEQELSDMSQVQGLFDRDARGEAVVVVQAVETRGA